MKKQTAALVISLLVVLLLSGMMVFLLIRFGSDTPQSEQQTEETDERLTVLSMSVDEINTISVENTSDSFTLVNQGDGFLVEGLEEAAASKLNVNKLTAFLSDLKADREILSVKDIEAPGESNDRLKEYGLDKPQCIVRIVSAQGEKEELFFGSEAPDNKSVYLMYGEKVYLMDDDIIDTVSKTRYSFLDNMITGQQPEFKEAKIILSGKVRPSPITLQIKTDSRTDEEGNTKKTSEYTLTTPLVQTITEASSLQVTEGLFDLYANTVETVSPTADEMTAFGLDEPYSVVSLDIDGTPEFTLKTSAPDENNYVYLMKDNSPMVYMVSARRLSWLKVQAEQLTGSVYVPVKTEELSELRVVGRDKAYDFVVSQEDGQIKVSCNGSEVDAKRFEELYKSVTAIEPERLSGGTPSLEAALTITVSYKDEEREDDKIELVPTGGGEVYIVINEESRYTASQDVVYEILEECEKIAGN